MIVTVSGDPRTDSPTLHLAERVGVAITAHLGWSAPVTVDLAQLGPGPPGPRPPNPDRGEVIRAVDLVRRAGLLVVATSSGPGGLPGVLERFGAALPADGLLGIGAVPVVTGPEPRGCRETHRRLVGWLTGLGASVVDPPLLVPETLAARPRAVALAYAVRLLGARPGDPARRPVRAPA